MLVIWSVVTPPLRSQLEGTHSEVYQRLAGDDGMALEFFLNLTLKKGFFAEGEVLLWEFALFVQC